MMCLCSHHLNSSFSLPLAIILSSLSVDVWIIKFNQAEKFANVFPECVGTAGFISPKKVLYLLRMSGLVSLPIQ